MTQFLTFQPWIFQPKSRIQTRFCVMTHDFALWSEKLFGFSWTPFDHGHFPCVWIWFVFESCFIFEIPLPAFPAFVLFSYLCLCPKSLTNHSIMSLPFRSGVRMLSEVFITYIVGTKRANDNISRQDGWGEWGDLASLIHRLLSQVWQGLSNTPIPTCLRPLPCTSHTVHSLWLLLNMTVWFFSQVFIFNNSQQLQPHDGRDMWHSHFVKMPYSPANVVSIKTGFMKVCLRQHNVCWSAVDLGCFLNWCRKMYSC